MMAPANDDFELWQSLKGEDINAFQRIYNDHFQPLFDYGMRFTHDKELVRDAIHDLFVKLWHNKKNLGDVRVIRAYLLVSLKGNIINKLSREKKIVSEEINENIPFEMVFSVENEIIRKESEKIKIKNVTDALNELSSRQKEILYLRFFMELDYEKIADILEISIKATYKLNARALKALRDILSLFFLSALSIKSGVIHVLPGIR